MEMSQVEIHFDPEQGILYKTYHGNVTITDIEQSWDRIISDKLIPMEVIGFILDYRVANFNVRIGEHHKISDFFRRHLDVFKDKKIAIITDNPKDVVIPVLVRMNDHGYQSMPFCSLDAAAAWILSP